MFSLNTFTFLLLTFCPSAFFLELPSYMHKCRLRDPELNDCIKENANFAIPFMKKEDKVHRLPSVTPLVVERVITEPSRNFKIELIDAKSYGFENSSVLNVSVDVDKKTWSIHIFIPKWILISEYKIDGRILLLAMQGGGPSNITIDDFNFFYSMKYGLKTKKDGKEYMYIKQANADYTIGKIYIKLENLFKGNERLNNDVNRIFNENWMALYEELRPAISETMETVATAMYDGIFSTVPYENMFIFD